MTVYFFLESKHIPLSLYLMPFVAFDLPPFLVHFVSNFSNMQVHY
jgi:hypothetical protein